MGGSTNIWKIPYVSSFLFLKASLSINRKAQNSAKESSVTILKKVMETLKLIKYEDIQIITRGYNKSPSLGIYKKKLLTTEDLDSLG